MTAPLAITVDHLSKRFELPRERVHTLKERALHPLRRQRYDKLQVLDDVSFSVARGEFFGVVGRNGSGKSTLLKCMAGIYRADHGRIAVAGRLAPFIELGVGFNPELTARENVIINAVMMGLSPREAQAKFDEIIEFAELENFLDLKLKNYSSGMQVRLAFAVMVFAEADVLLIDEVLAVGDAAFQQKCFDVFHRLRREGRTIVLVTHEMGLVERFCHRAMLIVDGEVLQSGDPIDVGRRYLAQNFDAQGEATHAHDDRGRVSIEDVWVTLDGERVAALPHGQVAEIHARFRAHSAVEEPGIALWLTNADGVRICSFGAREHGGAVGTLAAGEEVEVCVAFDNRLASGRVTIGCSVTRGTTGADLVVVQDVAGEFVVYGGEHAYGVVALSSEVSLERRPEVTA